MRICSHVWMQHMLACILDKCKVLLKDTRLKNVDRGRLKILSKKQVFSLDSALRVGKEAKIKYTAKQLGYRLRVLLRTSTTFSRSRRSLHVNWHRRLLPRLAAKFLSWYCCSNHSVERAKRKWLRVGPAQLVPRSQPKRHWADWQSLTPTQRLPVL